MLAMPFKKHLELLNETTAIQSPREDQRPTGHNNAHNVALLFQTHPRGTPPLIAVAVASFTTPTEARPQTKIVEISIAQA